MKRNEAKCNAAGEMEAKWSKMEWNVGEMKQIGEKRPTAGEME